MLSITRLPEFDQCVPAFLGACIVCRVKNAPTPPELWNEIEAYGAQLRTLLTPDQLKAMPTIAATREAYKACGKDPSRYRPASEQLARRLLQGKSLHSVSTLVDLGNLASLMTGYATGLLDADCVVGDVALGIGRADEPYEGIGRGTLNIEGLPVYRDEQGAIASPTSDSVRTMTTEQTQRLLFFINGYGGDRTHMERAVELSLALLRRYAASSEETVLWY